MKGLKLSALLFALLVAVYVSVALFLPSRIEVEQSQKIYAQPKAVFYQIACLKHWEGWSVHRELAPQTEFVYNDTICGENACCSWSSESFGSGSWRIDSLSHNSFVRIDYRNANLPNGYIDLTLKEDNDITTLTWKFRSTEVSLFMRPLKSLIENALLGKIVLNLKGLKRESEIHSGDQIRLYEYEFNIAEKEVLPIELLEYRGQITLSDFGEFTELAKERISISQDELIMPSRTIYFTVFSDNDGVFSVALGRQKHPMEKMKTGVVQRFLNSTSVVQVELRESQSVNRGHKALAEYFEDNNIEVQYPVWYEFDDGLKVKSAINFKPNRVVYPVRE